MKIIENSAFGAVVFLCIGVMQMAVAVLGGAIDTWREQNDTRTGKDEPEGS